MENRSTKSLKKLKVKTIGKDYSTFTKAANSPNGKALSELFKIDYFREAFIALLPLMKINTVKDCVNELCESGSAKAHKCTSTYQVNYELLMLI